jgi:UDP-N-acetylmuramoyl-L-alanyl-D-glutamate--2,6-diaminopimelate ligase
MQLKELLPLLRTTGVDGPVDREIVGISYDSRRVTPGMLFVAIPGQQTDGHDHIASAVDRGAAAVICQRNGFVPARATKIKVADTREALARAAAAFYGHPSTKLKVIGVTGTNGKTTVAFLIKHLLETAGVRTGLIGTVQYEIGERVIPAQRTTPEALEIQQMMAQMVRAGCGACVMEVSSHALDQQRVAEVAFDLGVFTNLTQDHLDYHRTMENYYAAKRRLFTALEIGPKNAASVINVDDPYGARLAHETHLPRRLTYGLTENAQVHAEHLTLDADGAAFVVRLPQGDGLAGFSAGERAAGAPRLQCRLPLIGRHNVYNALAALGAGLALGLEEPTIRRALATAPPVPGRLERIELGQPFGVFVDYAHTDDALRHVLLTLREITGGRVLLVFGCGGCRDAGKRPNMGWVAAELADFTLITADNPRKESPAHIAAQIVEGYRLVRRDGYRVELDRRRAIEELLRLAQPGDAVLIAGKGHETYQEFADTIVPFDDRACAREALEALGYTGGPSATASPASTGLLPPRPA